MVIFGAVLACPVLVSFMFFTNRFHDCLVCEFGGSPTPESRIPEIHKHISLT